MRETSSPPIEMCFMTRSLRSVNDKGRLQAELRRGVSGTELEARKTRRRGDRDDVSRALLAHHRQDGAGDVHWAHEARRELPLHLPRRQLLEVARVKAGSVVDQHVDPAE